MRVLVLSAAIGEGHITAARALVAKLERRPEVTGVVLRTELDVLGPRFGRFLTRGFHTHLEKVGWTYDLAYRVFFQRRWPRRIGQWALGQLGGPGMLRAIAQHRPDVVVTEFPVLSTVLGELRAHGRLGMPVCSAVSDPAGLYYWVHPGVDLHLLSWPQSKAEAETIGGPGRAVVTRPLIDERFGTRLSRERTRVQLALPESGTVVVVSGGGWGMGDLAGAVEVTRRTLPEAVVVVLTGHNQDLRRRLEQTRGDDGRVRVLGFTDRMPELMAAADALIHTTGGTTALEAVVVGTRLINYGRGVAHVRAHAAAMARIGLAEWAQDQGELGPALKRSLGARPAAPLDVSRYPDPADLVVALGRRTEVRGRDAANHEAAAVSAWADGAGA